MKVEPRTWALTVAALVSFGANSVLCRIALAETAIDPATFSTIRLVAGALTLSLIAGWPPRPTFRSRDAWASAVMLLLYAIPFAFAYTRLSAGTGALILFGCVQITMIIGARRAAEPLSGTTMAGIGLAFAGLVYLVWPGLAAPPADGALLMAVAGVCWGVYSLWGRGVADPLARTTSNFVLSVPMALLLAALSIRRLRGDAPGMFLAVVSGAVTSGLGYVAWFGALRVLTAVRAAVLQLVVPVLAALGGVIFLGEPVPPRLVFATALILGGVGIVIRSRVSPRVSPAPRSPFVETELR